MRNKPVSYSDYRPAGFAETLKDLAADKFYSILEGQGIVPGREDSSGGRVLRGESLRSTRRAAGPSTRRATSTVNTCS